MSDQPRTNFMRIHWDDAYIIYFIECEANDVCWWLGRPVNAHFLMRFSHRHSVFLCIFYHVYHGFVGWGGVGWGGMITFMLRVMHNALRC